MSNFWLWPKEWATDGLNQIVVSPFNFFEQYFK